MNFTYHEVISLPEFQKITLMVESSSAIRQKLQRLLSLDFSSIPLVVTYAMHIHGLCHLEYVLSNLKFDEFDLQRLVQQWKTLDKISLESLLSFALSNWLEHTFTCCQQLVFSIIDAISSYTSLCDGLLTLVLPFFLESPHSSLILPVLLQKLITTKEYTETDGLAEWKSRPTPMNDMARKIAEILFRLVPSQTVIHHLISMIITLPNIVPALAFGFILNAPQEQLWGAFDSFFDNLVAYRNILGASKLLLISYHLSDKQYYNFMIGNMIRLKAELKTVFEVILTTLHLLPSHIATEHVHKLKVFASTTSHSPFQVFSTEVTQMMKKRDAQSSTSVASPSTDPTSTPSHESQVKKWILHFNQSSKLPLKELSTMKMFAAAELSNALDFLLHTTKTLDNSAASVQLVLQLGKLKWFSSRQFENWEKSRISLQRRKVASTTPISTVDLSIHVSKFVELQESIDRWSKNIATESSHSFSVVLDSLLNRPLDNVSFSLREVHNELWKALLGASQGDWTKKTLALDKFISSTFVAQSSHLYPILFDQIMDDRSDHITPIAIILCTIASHDRQVDRNFLSSLWSQNRGLLQINSKISFQMLAVLVRDILRFCTSRFKAIAVATPHISNERPSLTSSLTLDPPNKRIGILDHHFACFAIWIKAKCETTCKEDPIFALRFSSLNRELSEAFHHRLIQPMLSQSLTMDISSLIELEAGFEQFSEISISDVKSALKSRFRLCVSDEEKITLIKQLSMEYQKVDFQKNPIVSRTLKNLLYENSTTFFCSVTSSTNDQGTQNINQRSSIPIEGRENAEPNTTFSAKKSIFPTTMISSSPQNSLSPSPQLTSSQGRTSISSKRTQLVPMQVEESTSSNSWIHDLLDHSLLKEPSSSTDTFDNRIEDLTKCDERWWVVSNENFKFLSVPVIKRFCFWYNQNYCTISSTSIVSLLTSILKGLIKLSKASKNANSSISDATHVILSSSPQMVLFLHRSRHLFHNVLFDKRLNNKSGFGELFSVFESLDSLGRIMSPSSTSFDFQTLNIDFIETNINVCCAYIGTCVEKGEMDPSRIFSMVLSTNQDSMIRLMIDVILLIYRSHPHDHDLQKSLSPGIIQSPKIFNFLVLQLTNTSDSSTFFIAKQLLEPPSSDLLVNEIEKWDYQTKKRWIQDFSLLLESLQWSFFWKHHTLSVVEGANFLGALHCLFIDLLHKINRNHELCCSSEKMLPSSILFPSLAVNLHNQVQCPHSVCSFAELKELPIGC
jgi:hypothetical protein